MKPSERYRRDAEALVKFRESYVRLLNATRAAQPIFKTQLLPNVPVAEWNELRHEVSINAGAALPAYARLGAVSFTLRNAAYTMNGVNPLTNWELSLDDPALFPPETVVSAVEAAIGLGRARQAEAVESERGLVGLAAAFLRWPSELREAVGPDHRAQRRAAGVLGVVAQIAVGVVATIVAGVVVALVVAGWRSWIA